MGGICGWLQAEVAGARPEEAPAVTVMRRALAHRGSVHSLPAERGEGGARAVIVADAPDTGQPALRQAWTAARGDATAFAAGLQGAFAVAVHDAPGRRLLLVRDRLGEKPLCYTLSGTGVAFASEMKALLAAGLDGGRHLRPEAVDAYLAFTYVPAPWTILAGVHKVPAGHLVEIDLSESPPRPMAARRYWDCPPREDLQATPQEALRRLREALRRRMPPGERMAAFLSGGLDSAVVVALLKSEGLERLSTFSVGFEEPSLDESAHARRVAALLGTDHHEIRLREATPALVGSVVRHLDEPMADAASLPTWLLAKAASGISPVAMTGDGADALLAGDHWFRRLRRMDRLISLPPAARRLVTAVAAAGGRRQGVRMKELAALAGLEPAARYLRIREKWTPEERLGVYAEPFRARVDTALTAGTYTAARVDWSPGFSVDAAVRLDSIHGLPEDLLMKVDKMGMAHGVECRSPFLDREWVEWVCKLDMNLLLRGGTSKYLLKRAAEALLPPDLVRRPKQGFRVPVGRWLKGPLRPLLDEAFDPGLLERQAVFDPAALRRILRAFDAGPSTAAQDGRIWQVVCFQTWWRQVMG